MSRDTQAESSNQWMHHMRNGAFEKAWLINDEDVKAHAGKTCFHLPRHLQYVWNGKPLNNKNVLIRCYHGLGDTIQFIRYAPLVKIIAKKVIVWAQPELISLLKTVNGIDELLPLHDGSPYEEYDIDVEVMELPHIFRSTCATIPLNIPYLHVEPLSLPSNKNNLKVGLVWKAGDWDTNRDIPFADMLQLKQIPNIEFYILQSNPQAAGWQNNFGIYLGAFSLYDYARVIKGLDLLITIDSMPAHLAGALGVPVWTLLQAKADWRWIINRNDCIWYPTTRLFWQQEPGDWKGVIKDVLAKLKV